MFIIVMFGVRSMKNITSFIWSMLYSCALIARHMFDMKVSFEMTMRVSIICDLTKQKTPVVKSSCGGRCFGFRDQLDMMIDKVFAQICLLKESIICCHSKSFTKQNTLWCSSMMLQGVFWHRKSLTYDVRWLTFAKIPIRTVNCHTINS